MRILSSAIGATLLGASVLVAQATPRCTRGAAQDSAQRAHTPIIVNGKVASDSIPFVATTGLGFLASGAGEAFGITSYRCAACQMKKEPGRPPEDSFMAEPVVMSVSASTSMQRGDVIEAVDGQPITSSVGSSQFSHPDPGVHTLTVRRGRERVTLRFDISPLPPCRITDTTYRVIGRLSETVGFDTVRVGQKLFWLIPGVRITGTAQPQPRTIHLRGMSSLADSAKGPIYVIDGVRFEQVSLPPVTKYGFELSCRPICTRVTNPDGTTFYRFGAPPTIVTLRDDSPASKIGLRVGDVVVKVDGAPILTDDGAIKLARSEEEATLQLTVLRDGKEISYLLQAPK
jgi:hypothetical protein